MAFCVFWIWRGICQVFILSIIYNKIPHSIWFDFQLKSMLMTPPSTNVPVASSLWGMIKLKQKQNCVEMLHNLSEALDSILDSSPPSKRSDELKPCQTLIILITFSFLAEQKPAAAWVLVRVNRHSAVCMEEKPALCRAWAQSLLINRHGQNAARPRRADLQCENITVAFTGNVCLRPQWRCT